MNSVSDCVASVAQRANGYNFDVLLKVLTFWNDPAEVRRHLLTIYFHGAQAVFDDQDVTPGTIGESFSVLQEIIEALDSVNDTNSARLAVTIK